MTTEVLKYALEGSTAVLTMDDGKANALSETMITSLLDALARAEREASAVMLTGRAERFCAGFDLKVMTAGPEGVRKLFLHGVHAIAVGADADDRYQLTRLRDGFFNQFRLRA